MHSFSVISNLITLHPSAKQGSDDAKMLQSAGKDDQTKEKINMKQAILAVTAIGFSWLLVAMAHDIKRYLRIRAM